MTPVIALVGRPNVGKSTLFNHLTRTRDALVADFPGLTRDRQYGRFVAEQRSFVIIDTGGIYASETALIDDAMASQSLRAAEEADLIFWLVDARAGLTGADQQLVEKLRGMDKQVWLLVNKSDGLDPEQALVDFYQLGFKQTYAISASQGRGLRQLKEALLEHYADLPAADDSETETEGAEARIKIAVLGRPNVGKSTLVNRMLGEERVVVFDMPGTTRDSVYIDFDRADQAYTLIDTAGIRRRKNIKETVEKFSIVKTIQAIDDAHVVILLIDAHEGLVDQDLHLLGMTMKAGRALVLAINKWDGLEHETKNDIRRELERRLRFIDYAEVHFISALHGSGVGKLFGTINQAYTSARKKLATPRLTQVLEGLVFDHPPPMVNGRRIKLRYAHIGGHNPPRIVIHGNQVDKVPEHYVRYLEKGFRKHLNLVGTPVRIEFKGGDNPFAGRRNMLTDRQKKKKQRLKKFTKKRK